jgi:hypothetical protein
LRGDKSFEEVVAFLAIRARFQAPPRREGAKALALFPIFLYLPSPFVLDSPQRGEITLVTDSLIDEDQGSLSSAVYSSPVYFSIAYSWPFATGLC